MSKYFEFTPKSINIREDGPEQDDPILASITPDDMLGLIRPTSWKPTEAATPEPGGLDAAKELIRLTNAYTQAGGNHSGWTPAFRTAFAAYLRDIESRLKPTPVAVATDSELSDRAEELAGELEHIAELAHDASTGPTVEDTYWEIRQTAYRVMADASQLATDLKAKPAEPGGWPEVKVTKEDTQAIIASAHRSWVKPSNFKRLWAEMVCEALQEWLDSKPRPTPVYLDVTVTRDDLLVVNELARRLLDADPDHRKEAAMLKALQEWIDHKRQSRPITFIPTGVTATIIDTDPFMTFAGTPESVELTREQANELVIRHQLTPAPHEGAAVNAALREMGLGLHRLDPKPSAEPDPGEDGTIQDIDAIEDLAMRLNGLAADLFAIKDDLGKVNVDLVRRLNALGERLAAVENALVPVGPRLDAIAERLDGPKVEEVPINLGITERIGKHFAIGEFTSWHLAMNDLRAMFARENLMIIRNPKGDA